MVRAIVEDVVERVGHFARRAQAAGEEAVVEDRAPADQGEVDALGDGDAQPLHAAREALELVCLDDHVDVGTLHGEVDQAEAVFLATAAERLADLPPEPLAAEAAYVASGAPDDVQGERLAKGFAAVMGDAVPALAAGAGAVTTAASAGKGELFHAIEGTEGVRHRAGPRARSLPVSICRRRPVRSD